MPNGTYGVVIEWLATTWWAPRAGRRRTSAGAQRHLGERDLYGVDITGTAHRRQRHRRQRYRDEPGRHRRMGNGMRWRAIEWHGNGSADNTIGGTAAPARATSSRATPSDGVEITGAGTTGNVVAGQLHRHRRHRGTAPGQRRTRRRDRSRRDRATRSAARPSPARNLISGNAFAGVLIDGIGHQRQRRRSQLDRHRRQPGSSGTDGIAVLTDPVAGNIGGGVVDRERRLGQPIGTDRLGRRLGRGQRHLGERQRWHRSRDTGTSGNLVAGNLIGTDADRHRGPGQSPATGSISIDGATDNTIGGTAPAPATSSRATDRRHLDLRDRASGNLVEGNLHRHRTHAGPVALANTDDGVDDRQPAPRQHDRRHGGRRRQRHLRQHRRAASAIADRQSGNLVQGNYIGTNAAGTARAGQRPATAIDDLRPSNNTIGGTAAGAGNVISGNAGDGHLIIDGTGPRQPGRRATSSAPTPPAPWRWAIVDRASDIDEAPSSNTIGGTASATATGTSSPATPATASRSTGAGDHGQRGRGQLHRHQRRRHRRPGQRRCRASRSSGAAEQHDRRQRRPPAGNVISGNTATASRSTARATSGNAGRGQPHRHQRGGHRRAGQCGTTAS